MRLANIDKVHLYLFYRKNNQINLEGETNIGKLSVSDDLMAFNSHLNPNSPHRPAFSQRKYTIDLSVGYPWCFSHLQQMTKQNAPRDYHCCDFIEIEENKRKTHVRCAAHGHIEMIMINANVVQNKFNIYDCLQSIGWNDMAWRSTAFEQRMGFSSLFQ